MGFDWGAILSGLFAVAGWVIGRLKASDEMKANFLRMVDSLERYRKVPVRLSASWKDQLERLRKLNSLQGPVETTVQALAEIEKEKSGAKV